MKTKEIKIKIKGMSCNHCAISIEKEVNGIEGVSKIEVNYPKAMATIIMDEKVESDQIISSIKKMGYGAELQKESYNEKSIKSCEFDSELEYSADMIVIGGGSAGFSSAITASEAGKRVIIVNWGMIGGTCVNVGCVPSKALIRAAQAHFDSNSTRFKGVSGNSKISDFSAIMKDKDSLVESLRKAKYIDVLKQYENVKFITGHAKFISSDKIKVGYSEYFAPKIVISTGSSPWIPEVLGLNEIEPLSSTTAFELKNIPKSMIILGGRFIAIECAQIFSRLGSKVTILQRSSHILPSETPRLSRLLKQYLENEGIKIKTSVNLKEFKKIGGKIEVIAERKGEKLLLKAEKVLCATGRRPNVLGMNLKSIGVEFDEKKGIKVNKYLESTVPGIYAVGDVIGEPAFVYTAAYEGKIAAKNAINEGKRIEVNYNPLPWVIFSDPQIAGVGLNEIQAKEKGIEVDVSTLELKHVPRAIAAQDTRGFIELIKEKDKDKILGARIMAQEGGEQIMEISMAIKFGIGVSDLINMFHPYLTQSEGIKLCAQGFNQDVSKLSCCSG